MEEEKKEELITKEEYQKLKRSNEKKKALIVVLIFACVLFAMLALLFYLGIFNSHHVEKTPTPTATPGNDLTEKQECQCENTPTECNCPKCPNYTGCLGEEVSLIKTIELTNNNQTVKVGKKEYKIRIEENVERNGNTYDECLAIDDIVVMDHNGDCITVNHAYVTDKFIIFTVDMQRGETIVYVIGEQGDISFVFDGSIAPDSYDMHNFQVKDGYLFTDEFRIKYIDNTLLVVNK